ncbi:MAG: RNA polymerase subunit sigma-24 [Opitutia bacterium]|nr:sigma-70 family RNA polymerase sigma factor [Opitutales bacterium]PHX68900.1 MAG: RNA polymerase subunit sigma-24 [Opitutae bacterium]
MDNESEELTLNRARKGDLDAYNQLVLKYQERIFAKVFSMLRNSQDAEEITQDTFIRAHRALATFRGNASFSTWIYQIGTNLARNRYWYWKRRKRDESMSLDADLGEDAGATLHDILSDGAQGPGHEAQHNEFVKKVADCMEQLKPEHALILTMRNVQNISYEDIAQELGLSIGTVKSRINRARGALRELMGDEYLK